MRNKKGSILLISSWVLLILVVLAIGLGHRSSIALRLSAYQRDNLKASYLAKAGINQAILRLKEDAGFSYNSLKSIWSTGVDPLTSKPLFENVEIREGSGEKFTVRYPYNHENYLCMMDEERKININKIAADREWRDYILTKLFDYAAVQDPVKLKDIFIKWIDTAYDQNEDPDKIFKNSDLQTTEELLPILEFFYKDETNPSQKAKEDYERIRGMITVYGDGNININTVDKVLLELLIQSCKDKVEKEIPGSPTPTDLGELSIKINEYLDKNGYFTAVTLVNRSDLGLSTDSLDNIITKLQSIIKVKSDNFRINSTGEITGKSISKTITCVFSRSPENKIIYWHEN